MMIQSSNVIACLIPGCVILTVPSNTLEKLHFIMPCKMFMAWPEPGVSMEIEWLAVES